MTWPQCSYAPRHVSVAIADGGHAQTHLEEMKVLYVLVVQALLARLSTMWSSRWATSLVTSMATFAEETLSVLAGDIVYSLILASPGITWKVVIGSKVNAPVPSGEKS